MKWPTLDAGDLRQQITILQQASGTDASGSNTVWTTLVTTYAAIKTIRATDVIRAGQTTAQAFYEIKMWWQSGIQPGMQIQGLNGRYVIQAVENINELNVVLTLTCIALGLNDG